MRAYLVHSRLDEHHGHIFFGPHDSLDDVASLGVSDFLEQLLNEVIGVLVSHQSEVNVVVVRASLNVIVDCVY